MVPRQLSDGHHGRIDGVQDGFRLSGMNGKVT